MTHFISRIVTFEKFYLLNNEPSISKLINFILFLCVTLSMSPTTYQFDTHFIKNDLIFLIIACNKQRSLSLSEITPIMFNMEHSGILERFIL